MKMSKFLPPLLLAGLGFLGLAASAHASTLDDIQKRGELRIAVQTQGPPFSMIDKNGERTGSAVELAKLMAQEMGVKVVFLDLDWDGLLPALISGKADLLAADMTPTLARATKVAFTKPWLYVGPVVATKEGSKFTSTNACKAPGTKIAVLFGSTGEKLSKTVFPEGRHQELQGWRNLVAGCGEERLRRIACSMTAPRWRVKRPDIPREHSRSCPICLRGNRWLTQPVTTLLTC